jgi:hypothetical protein
MAPVVKIEHDERILDGLFDSDAAGRHAASQLSGTPRRSPHLGCRSSKCLFGELISLRDGRYYRPENTCQIHQIRTIQADKAATITLNQRAKDAC